VSLVPHTFSDPALLELALTHASASGERNNERLEFLGDAVLDLIVAAELYRQSPELPEGAMTQRKAHVVSRKTLARAADRLGLAGAARFGGGMRRRALPASVLANLFEAVLGAIYVDAGYEAARGFALDYLREALAVASSAEEIDNPKQQLQELCQARYGLLPEYQLVVSRRRAHARAFLMVARIDEQTFPSAWGRTRKEAETWAAHEALLVLGEDGAEHAL
jgi:ribonuclease-3